MEHKRLPKPKVQIFDWFIETHQPYHDCPDLYEITDPIEHAYLHYKARRYGYWLILHPAYGNDMILIVRSPDVIWMLYDGFADFKEKMGE
jgi:hypothetical protein